jgi:hypothetical protein
VVADLQVIGPLQLTAATRGSNLTMSIERRCRLD